MGRFFSDLFAAPAAPVTRKARLGLDGIGLEDRRVMSVTTQFGATDFGVTWRFTYDDVARTGTFTVTGSNDQFTGDSFSLTERQNNAQVGEPGYGDNRPVGIDIVESGTGRTGGSPNFLPGSTVTVVVNARNGDDSVTNATRYASTLDGGDGNDYLRGSDTAADLLVGGTGNDHLEGRGGNDDLWGDRRLFDAASSQYYSPLTGAGNDVLIGGQGDDQLRGGDGKDQLWGDDRQLAQASRVVYQQYGWMILPVVQTGSRWVSSSAGGNDTLYGGDGSAASGAEVNDNDVLVGGAGNDHLSAGFGNDWAFGGAGDDTIQGGAGNDNLNGGDGTDPIYDTLGTNTVNANGGNDPAWFTTEWSAYVG